MAFPPLFDEAQMQAAAEWIVREHEADFSPAEAEARDRWLKADPANGAAYERLLHIWDVIPRHPALLNFPLAANDQDADDAVLSSSPSRFLRKAGAIAMTTGVFAAVAAATVLFLRTPAVEAPAHFQTGFGQISKIALSDGSVVTLGPKTSFNVSFLPGERHVSLVGGEAFFEVAKNRQRPFTIDLGGSSIRVVGTKFNVLRSDARAKVAVVQGVVQLRGGQGTLRGHSLIGALHKGQLAEILPGAKGEPLVRTSAFNADDNHIDAISGGWRDGWLVYEDMPLREILSDVNRYYAPGVTMAEKDLGDLRLTASFRQTAVPQFVETLAPSLSVTVERLPNGAYRIERSRGRP